MDKIEMFSLIGCKLERSTISAQALGSGRRRARWCQCNGKNENIADWRDSGPITVLSVCTMSEHRLDVKYMCQTFQPLLESTDHGLPCAEWSLSSLASVFNCLFL